MLTQEPGFIAIALVAVMGAAVTALFACGPDRRRTVLTPAVAVLLASVMGNLGATGIARDLGAGDLYFKEYVTAPPVPSRVAVELNQDFSLNGPTSARFALTVWDAGWRVVLDVAGVARLTVSTRTGGFSRDTFVFVATQPGTYTLRFGTPDGFTTSYNSNLRLSVLPLIWDRTLDVLATASLVAVTLPLLHALSLGLRRSPPVRSLDRPTGNLFTFWQAGKASDAEAEAAHRLRIRRRLVVSMAGTGLFCVAFGLAWISSPLEQERWPPPPPGIAAVLMGLVFLWRGFHFARVPHSGSTSRMSPGHLYLGGVLLAAGGGILIVALLPRPAAPASLSVQTQASPVCWGDFVTLEIAVSDQSGSPLDGVV